MEIDYQTSPRNNKEYVQLTKNLFKHCMLYMNLRKYTEKTKMQYLQELKELFKNKELTQYIYTKYWQKGHSYRAILNIILKTCWFYEFPYYHYKVVKRTKSDKEKDLNTDMEKIFREEEIKHLALLVPNGLLVECAYYIGAGLRFSSVIKLRWNDFRWDEWKDRNSSGKVLVHAKGNKTAVLPVHPYLMNKLYNIAKENQRLFMEIPYKNFAGKNYLFLKEKDIEDTIESLKKKDFELMLDDSPEKELKIDYEERAIIEESNRVYESLKYGLNKHAKEFKVNRVRFHSFRKSAATNLLNKGWSLIKIKKLLMHESISTTEMYTKVDSSEIEKEFNELFKLN